MQHLIAIFVAFALVILCTIAMVSGLSANAALPKFIGCLRLFFNTALGNDLLVSLFRYFTGLLLGWVVGCLLGMLCGRFHSSRNGLRGPVVGISYFLSYLRTIPIIGLPVLVLPLFGFSEPGKIVIVSWGVALSVWVVVEEQSRQFRSEYLVVAEGFGLTGYEQWKRVILPGLRPAFFESLRLGSGVAVLCLPAAELLGMVQGSTFFGGLGYRLWEFHNGGRSMDALILLIFFGLLGFLSDRIILYIRPLFVPWERSHPSVMPPNDH